MKDLQQQALCPIRSYGNRLAWAAGQFLVVYDLETKSFEFDGSATPVEGGHSDAIRGIAFSQDGSVIASAGEDKRIVFWSQTGGSWKPVGSYLHAKKIMTIEFESEFSVIFGDKFGDFFRLKNMTDSEILFGHLAAVSCSVMSQKRSLLVSADRDEKIRITQFPKVWNIASFLFGHKRYISCLAFFNQEETRVVSAGADGLVILWDISDPNAPSQVWTATVPEGPVNSVSVRPDGEVLILRSDEPSVAITVRDGQVTGKIDLGTQSQTLFNTQNGSLGFVDDNSHIGFVDGSSVHISRDVAGVPISLMKFVHHENLESGEFEDRKRQRINA